MMKMTKETAVDFMNAMKETELKALVTAFGIDEVLNAVKDKMTSLNKETESAYVINAKELVPQRAYHPGYHPQYSESVKQIVREIVKEIPGLGLRENSEGVKSHMVTNMNFACYIVSETGNGDVLRDILSLLVEANWDASMGITRQKMEMLYHTMILHQTRWDEVMKAIATMLHDYDLINIKVKANEDDRYKHHLSLDEKVVMWFETQVCEMISATPRFMKVA